MTRTLYKEFHHTAFREAIEYADDRSRLGHNTRRMRSDEGAEPKFIRVFWSPGWVDLDNAVDIKAVEDK